MAAGGVVIEPKSAAAAAIKVSHGHRAGIACAASICSGGPRRRRGQPATSTCPTGRGLLGHGPGRRSVGHLFSIRDRAHVGRRVVLGVVIAAVHVRIAVATGRHEPNVAGIVLALGPRASNHLFASCLAAVASPPDTTRLDLTQGDFGGSKVTRISRWRFICIAVSFRKDR